MKGYSKYFSFEELTDSDSFPHLVEQNRKHAMQFINAGKRLSKLLESIRHILGDKPLTVSSGFRNPTLNIAVGSKAKNSTHQRFEAADLFIKDRPLQEAFVALMTAHKGGLLPDLRKAIREDHKGIIHVEVKMKAEELTEFYTTKDNVKFKKVV